jgi:hypothetical protein
MNRRLALLFLLLALAPSLLAIPLAGEDVLVPIAGRTPGANGTFWKTDLTISNLSTVNETVPVTLSLTDASSTVSSELRLSAGESVLLSDVLLSVFERETGTGALRVTGDAPLLVRARIYTTHPTAGEFSQSVQGLPVDSLAAENDLSGIFDHGFRTNVGIASPLGDAVATLRLRDRFGSTLRTHHVTVSAGQVVQLNDILHVFELEPAQAASIHVSATLPVYAYASVVRNDSGDPLFIAGTEAARPSDEPLAAACASPARLHLNRERGWPGFIVVFKNGVDSRIATGGLAAKYGFEPLYVYTVIPAFAAELPKEIIAALRCESIVEYIEQDAS